MSILTAPRQPAWWGLWERMLCTGGGIGGQPSDVCAAPQAVGGLSCCCGSWEHSCCRERGWPGAAVADCAGYLPWPGHHLPPPEDGT